jgi:hypothetical protein
LDDMTDDQFPSQPELSDQLQRFRLIRKLSETRMSVIYLAQEPHLGDRPVALKVIAPMLAHEPSFRERFRREMLSAANLIHPNIVPVYSAPADGELLYLVMPYVDGPNLRDVLKSGPLDLTWLVGMIHEVAAALDFAHASGVVHRDVKPGNILIERRTGRAMLCDFGIAAPALGERLTEVGRRVGTPGYLAPELIPAGEDTAAPVDPRADIYSLGVVLYQCLTGRAPHLQSDTGALLWAQGHEDAPPVTSLRPELPAALDKVIATALAKRPQDRYTSCQELADELTLAVSGGRVRGVRRTPRRGKVRWQPIAALAAAAAVIAAVTVVVVATTGGDSSASPIFRVPPSLRGDCDSTGVSPSGAEETLLCHDGDREVRFSLFADRSTMDNAYGDVVRDSGVARDTGDCTVATGAEHRYPNGGDQVGRVLCYTGDSTTSLVWTDDRQRTVAESDTREADDQNLAEAWTGWVGIPSFPTDGERSLIDLVELSRCERAQAGALATFRDLVAAIDCDPVSTNATAVSYYRFSTVDALRRTYDQHVDSANAPAGVECTDGAAMPKDFLGNRSFDLRSVDLGSKLCYLGDRGTPVLEWTIEPLSLMIRATGTTPADLVEWYHQTYGIPLAKVVAATNSTAKPPFPTSAESALLAHVPANTRNNCLRPPPNQVKDNFSTASTAAVVCGPSPGARVIFYYQFADVPAMNQAYVRGRTVSGGDCLASPPNFSADAPYARGGDTGRLGCGSAGGLNLAWTSERHAILTYAFQGYDQQELLAWWQNGAGPI